MKSWRDMLLDGACNGCFMKDVCFRTHFIEGCFIIHWISEDPITYKELYEMIK